MLDTIGLVLLGVFLMWSAMPSESRSMNVLEVVAWPFWFFGGLVTALWGLARIADAALSLLR